MKNVELGYRFYHQNIYPFIQGVPGTTRLNKVVEERFLPTSFSFNGVNIELENREQAREQILSNILKGYTQRRDIQPGDLVLDAGAFPGEFSIYAAKKGARVVALEPDPKNREKLRRNIRLNGDLRGEVIVLKYGLWSECTTVGLVEDGISSEIVETDDGSIETTTVEELVEWFGNFDFIKMDIEGAETRAVETVPSELDVFFSIASYHELEDQGRAAEIVEDKLEAKGFETETGFLNHLTTWGWKPQ